MRKNKILRQTVSYALLLSIVMSILTQAIDVKVSRGVSLGNDPAWTASNLRESEIDAKRDMLNLTPAGNWAEACGPNSTYRLPWNAFHNAVQDAIIEQNKGYPVMQKELTVDYYQGKKRGKSGRADLYTVSSDIIYIWEVKPLSYLTYSNRKKAINQLNNYIDNSIPKKKIYQGKQICNGEDYPEALLVGKCFVAPYIVDFYYSGDGIILYSFYRDDGEKEPEREPAFSTEEETEKENEKNMISNQVGVVYNERSLQEQVEEVAAQVAITVAVSTAVIMYVTTTPGLQETSLGTSCGEEGARLLGTVSEFLGKKTWTLAELQMARMSISNLQDYFLNMFPSGIGTLYTTAIASAKESDKEKLMKSLQGLDGEYTEAGNAQPPRDPLIIDLGDDGIKLCTLDDGVNFDLDNNGFAEKTAWIGTEDGFLAFDRNENGKIDNGGELFGDQVILADGSKSTSGFDALNEMNDDGNGIIDENDNAYDKLRVWIDRNHNGKSEVDELHTLAEMGIFSISTDCKQISIDDEETGTRIAETADVCMTKDGTDCITAISEFWFPINSADTTHGDTVTSGNVPDIENAIKADESGVLNNLMSDFISLSDVGDKRLILKKILYRITDAGSEKSASRGGNIDARDLKVVEQFMGREFIGVDGSGNPNVNAAAILEGIYTDIENIYYCYLNTYTPSTLYCNMIYKYTDDNGDCQYDMTLLKYILKELADDGRNIGSILYDVGVYLKVIDKRDSTNSYEKFKLAFSEFDDYYKRIIELSQNGKTFIGTEGDDSFSGTSVNDFIYGIAGNDVLSGDTGNDFIDGGVGNDSLSGGAGNDTLSGQDGNDTLDGGAGNDVQKGGPGDDTYIFSKGYGSDSIVDMSGSNTIWFKGLKKKDVSVNGVDGTDVRIAVKNASDVLTIKDFMIDEAFRKYTLKFDDMTLGVFDEGSPFYYIHGGTGDDVLEAVAENSYMYGYAGDDIIIGSDGGDIIYGNSGDDVIYAESGNDVVIAGDGDDVIDGGVGNDMLYGSTGNDRFVFGKNYGVDTVMDTVGKTVIQIDGMDIKDIQAVGTGDNCVIFLGDDDDRIQIANCMQRTEEITVETDDETMSLKELLDRSVHDGEYTDLVFDGTEQYDYYENISKTILSGAGEGDRIIGNQMDEYMFGDNGDDQIFSDDGDDLIAGGAGKDYINSGAGSDYIDPGTENDFMDGGDGDDIYIFSNGYGRDTIMDSAGNNTVIFEDGLDTSAIKAYRQNWNDIRLTFEGFEDELIIKNYCVSESARNLRLVFPDGTVVNATDKDSPLRSIYGADGSEYMISIYDDGITKFGQDGNDEIVGSDSDDYLYGGGGNDRITGNGGNDVLDGGEGNDSLYGGVGNDTYIFKSGYETDLINDSQGNNRIDIYGLTKGQLRCHRTNWNDLTMEFDGADDKLVLEGFFTSENNRNYVISFNGNQDIFVTDANSPLRTIYGSVSDDYIVALDDKGVTFAGCEGNDTLVGGKGNDIYFFNAGDGHDKIVDSNGINTIVFGDGLNEKDVVAYRTNWNDLTVIFDGAADKLVITGYFTSEGNRRFNVRFRNGNSYSYKDMENPLKKVHATEYDDWMTAWSDDGIILYGDGGNDTLFGDKGDDTLCGGAGNDTLSGQEGNDTYIIAEGYGEDRIEDDKGDSLILFIDLDFEQVVPSLTKSGDLEICIKGNHGLLKISSFDEDRFRFSFGGDIEYRYSTEDGTFVETQSE